MPELSCPHCGYDLSATPEENGVRFCSQCGRSGPGDGGAAGFNKKDWIAVYVWAMVAGGVVMYLLYPKVGLRAGALALEVMLAAGWLTSALIALAAHWLEARSRRCGVRWASAAVRSLGWTLLLLPIPLGLAVACRLLGALMNWHVE